MKKYALCYVEHEGSVLLIEKIKPEWQKGKINLPGGSFEEGEYAGQCAARELFEEANLLAFHVQDMGVIVGGGWQVDVVRCVVKDVAGWIAKTQEPVFWLPIQDALRHPKLIPNLRVIIPLCNSGVRGWVLQDGEPDYDIHLKITLPCVLPST
jgi:8-oxo-dGTP pyrophosphatase MutT (NUDIX family)